MAIHYTCDLCSKSINIDREVRYEVNIEIKAAFEAHDCDDAPCDLHDEMSELIDLMEELDSEDIEGGVYKIFRYDLCNDCRKRYMKDPFFRKSLRKLGFSEN